MKKFKLLTLGVAAALLFGMTAGCDEEKKTGGANVDIWSAYNSEKILQDKTYAEEERGEAKLSIQAYRNERETGQILLTPDADVHSFTVETGDLKSASGQTLSKDCLKVYFQMYIEIITPTTDTFPTGMYPDAVLPMAAAVEYGENKIGQGENQAILFDLWVPATQEAGIYTGEVQITCDGTPYEVPVSVEVWDYTLSDTNHLRTVFSIHRDWSEAGMMTGELDNSWEMYEKYYDFLTEFRISPRSLPYTSLGAKSDLDKFCEYALKESKNPRVSTYTLPYVSLGNHIDMDYYEDLLVAMMQTSVENDTDLFAKAVTYFSIFDEASMDTSGVKTGYANTILKAVKEKQEELAGLFRKIYGPSVANYKLETYIASMLDIEQLFVGQEDPRLNDGLNETYCPQVQYYNTEESRSFYLEKNPDERWWYTCISPKNPFPTYHIDDNLYSSRIMSWMQYKYGVQGNLYWSTTYWIDGETGKPLQDYYDTALRFKTAYGDLANGDGFLLYPGKPYGIDGPVASLRLYGIRDGMEDYEILYDIGEIAKAAAAKAGAVADINSVFEMLYMQLFEGTAVDTDSATLLRMRNSLAEIAEAAQNTGVVPLNGKIADGKFTAEIFCPADAQFGCEGAASRDVTGGKIYTVSVNLSEAANQLVYTAQKGEKQYTVNFDLGGRRVTPDAETFLADSQFVQGDKGSIVAGEAYGFGTADAVKVEFAASSGAQFFTYAPAAFSQFDRSKFSLRFGVYVEGDQEVLFNAYVKGDGSVITFTAFTGTLKPGYNTVTINLSGLSWAEIGNPELLRFAFGSTDGNDAQSVVIGNVIWSE